MGLLKTKLPFLLMIHFIWTPTVALATQLLVNPTSKDNSPECDCYLISGPSPGYFQYHRFWDFRNVPSDGENDYTTAPSLITSTESSGLEPFTSPYLNTTEFRNNWSIQSWTSNATADSPVTRVNSAQNVYISRNTSTGAKNSTYLTLRANRLSDFMSVSELESMQKNVFYSSIRTRLRVIPNHILPDGSTSDNATDSDETAMGINTTHPVSPGAVAGFFTYYSPTCESDTEILTSDVVSHIRYSNQPDYNVSTNTVIDGASTDAALSLSPAADWTQWLDHRLDWDRAMSRWWVDDVVVLNKTLNVPQEPSALILNLWSDGGTWSGNMSVGSQVRVGVEWIDMVFNVSGPVGGPPPPSAVKGRTKREEHGTVEARGANEHMCQVACRVDGVERVGFREVAFNATSGGGVMVRDGGMRTGFVTTLVVAMFVTGWIVVI